MRTGEAAGTAGSTSRSRRWTLEASGASVMEALVALLLGLFVVCLALSVAARQRAAVAALARTSDQLAAVRVARQVLGAEGRDGDPTRDGWVVSDDSLALRAFRGEAYLCGPGPTPLDVVVEVEGVRLPEPAKDSVLVLDGSGRWEASALDGVSTAVPCSPGDVEAQLWHLSRPPPPDGAFARYFERGAYHLSDGALRYRRGLSGRQPLTPAVLDVGESGFVDNDGHITLRLRVRGARIPWRIGVPAVEATGAGGSPNGG